MKPRNALIAAPLAALALAGCGGGSSNASAPVAAPNKPAPLSREELIRQGDAICAEVNAAVGTVSSTGSDAAGRAGQVAELYTGMAQRLKGLGTPEGSAGYQQFTSAAESLAQAENDARLAAERGETAGLEEAESRASSALSSFQSAANSYGFKDCGEAPSAPTPRSSTPSGGEEPQTGGAEAVEPEAAPETGTTPETGGAGSTETGGGAAGEETGGGSSGGGGSSSGGIGPG